MKTRFFGGWRLVAVSLVFIVATVLNIGCGATAQSKNARTKTRADATVTDQVYSDLQIASQERIERSKANDLDSNLNKTPNDKTPSGSIETEPNPNPNPNLTTSQKSPSVHTPDIEQKVTLLSPTNGAVFDPLNFVVRWTKAPDIEGSIIDHYNIAIESGDRNEHWLFSTKDASTSLQIPPLPKDTYRLFVRPINTKGWMLLDCETVEFSVQAGKFLVVPKNESVYKLDAGLVILPVEWIDYVGTDHYGYTVEVYDLEQGALIQKVTNLDSRPYGIPFSILQTGKKYKIVVSGWAALNRPSPRLIIKGESVVSIN